jgi:peptidase E
LDEFYPNNKRVRLSSSTQQISINTPTQQVDSIVNQKLSALANSHINPLITNPHVIAFKPENHEEISRANPLDENSIQLTSHVFR